MVRLLVIVQRSLFSQAQLLRERGQEKNPFGWVKVKEQQ
jgi:hypothetical protein